MAILNDDDAAIAQKHAARARKDASLNMRISSSFLAEIKETALAEGFEQYQAWVHMVLEEAVGRHSQGVVP